MSFAQRTVIVAFVIFLYADWVTARISTRCFVCRSRGELGDCRDSFNYNDTSIKEVVGNPISVTPCPSGWCAKAIEGIRGPPDEYGMATDRSCLLQAPSDGEERCAEVMRHNKQTRLCLCKGDLCNSAMTERKSCLMALVFTVLGFMYNAIVS